MRLRILVATAVLALVASPLLVAASSQATSGNPLTVGRFGVDSDAGNYVHPAYAASTGRNRVLLAKIALRPRVIQVGSWIAVSKVRQRIATLVANQQAGDRTKIVQFATFNLWPTGEGAVNLPRNYATTYRAWYQQFVAGIGSARAVVILESDLPVAVGSNRSPAAREALTRYAAQLLSMHPNITVYIDSGDSDWLTAARSAQMLKAAGVAYVRGFALGSTHYAPVGADIVYGTQVVADLARLGVRGKHLVIDTADNGRGFTWLQFRAYHPGQWFDNAMPCSSTNTRACVSLGIPPTTDVANLRWHLTAGQRSLALAHVDAYLWFGRPWLYAQAYPFNLSKALGVAAASVY